MSDAPVQCLMLLSKRKTLARPDAARYEKLAYQYYVCTWKPSTVLTSICGNLNPVLFCQTHWIEKL